MTTSASSLDPCGGRSRSTHAVRDVIPVTRRGSHGSDGDHARLGDHKTLSPQAPHAGRAHHDSDRDSHVCAKTAWCTPSYWAC